MASDADFNRGGVGWVGEEGGGKHALHTAGAREICIDQSGFSRREKF